MKVNLNNAAKIFFPSPSLEMVYFEAVSNSIDAGATEIDINIKITNFSNPETLTIEISDNGCGFKEENFKKFSSLLEVDEEDHKGLGRLVYLRYFKDIEITSTYSGQKRDFQFNSRFDGGSELKTTDSHNNRTTLKFKNYTLDKIKSYDYLRPDTIKKSLLLHFYPRLYNLKINQKTLQIRIGLTTTNDNIEKDFYSDLKTISISEIPNLEKEPIDAQNLDLFEKVELYYSIKEHEGANSVITAICVDERTFPIEILSKGGIPIGFEIIFLLYSNLFTGKVNPSRQELTFNDSELKIIKKIFSEKVAEILSAKIPRIQETNAQMTNSLEERFPHLLGFFEEKPVGLIDRNQSLEIAQRKFFNSQKELLEAQSLTDDQYQKSLEMSSRVLTEYVLYRNLIINKVKQLDEKSSESDIHNIIIPMRKKLIGKDFNSDLFTNNAWLLDDKYMSYTTILSDIELNKLLHHIALDEESIKPSDTRPDIAIVFSNSPEKAEKVDVVIVELKKKGLKLAKREEVVSQLKQRARKLLNYYPDKIQRIWFYGIVDFSNEFEISLREDSYAALFSKGTVYYKEQPIILDIEEPNKTIPVGLYIMSFDAFLNDAETRNSTFLRLLKQELKRNCEVN